ncbi:hypothetical protein [Bifidobacterium simiiventris]|uniref:hypothetical protein n=1 Tax=Bifidobacterium simiiventris TaxID=2834434 RepID=UPI001C559BEC|nr:hypothetical protein [Bifidobacterium simiiventris]MBW3078467.1 hypothetical protein [Bifidobacterium simiiventris]
MTVSLDSAAVARVAALPAVREAAEAGAQLVALWPLTDAKQMDNDAKYAENLQVRLTRMIARIVTGEDVTVPDAEFVYEGADEIPGRPQSIVDALLVANDAYDTMIDYRDAHDPDVLFDAVRAMGVDWPETTEAAVREALPMIERAVAEEHGDADATIDVPDVPESNAGAGDATSDVADKLVGALTDSLAHRFAESLVICDGLLSIIARTVEDAGDAGDTAAAQLPVILFVNELREQTAVPRLCLSDDQYRALLDARAGAADDGTLDATVDVIAPIAAAEWKRHYDDVTWDPEEAKRRAKEEDERKNKEALAAKFAHVKDDPTKPEVEL